jgi:uncharacterized protein
LRPPFFDGDWLHAVPDGLRLTVRATPGASRNRIDPPAVGADGAWHLPVKVRAPAVDNAANHAVCELVASWLGVSPRAVSVWRGETSRQKILVIQDASPSAAEALRKRAASLKELSFSRR